MTTPREDHTATLLSDGRVLIAGGYTSSMGADFWSGLASAELLDPKTGKFSPTGSLVTARTDNTATLLADGRVLIAGGWSYNNFRGPFLASAELYNPKTGTFSPAGSMATARVFHTATLIADGRVLIAGGESGTSSPFLASAELYNPKTSTFSPAGP